MDRLPTSGSGDNLVEIQAAQQKIKLIECSVSVPLLLLEETTVHWARQKVCGRVAALILTNCHQP